ncbi:MAG: MATE family efflux transporter [Verrucomicrobiota bacterium]
MQNSTTIRREAWLTSALALPLIAGQLNHMLISMADTLMIGKVGIVPLAASTLANTILYVPLMLGIGMSVAVSVRVSQARGAKDPAAARAALRHGLYLATAVGLFTVALSWLVKPFFPLFRQQPEVIQAAPTYFHLVACSMVPAIAALAIKSHSDAMNRPWPAFWVMFGGVILNVLLNWIFIFGNVGAPAMGLEGAGLATLLARIATMAGLICLCLNLPGFKDWVPKRWLAKPDWPAVRHLIAIGIPTSIQLLAEVGAFLMATFIIGSLGAEALASHQVAITCAATVFMIPLGISMAMTVRIGEVWGANQNDRMRPIVVGGWLMALGFTMLSATLFLCFNREIASWFITEPQALSLAAGLLLVAAAFQLSDAMQIISAGSLRGLNDVRIPAWIAFISYWIVALPMGWFFAFPLAMGVKGMWWGITIGLTITAITLGQRIWRMTGNRVPEFIRPETLPAENA